MSKERLFVFGDRRPRLVIEFNRKLNEEEIKCVSSAEWRLNLIPEVKDRNLIMLEAKD